MAEIVCTVIVIVSSLSSLLLQKKKSALFEVAEVVPVMTNNYEDNILKGVQASSYSLQSSMELLQKDVVQLHAPRYQSMRRVSQEPGVLPLGKPTKTMCVHTHTVGLSSMLLGSISQS